MYKNDCINDSIGPVVGGGRDGATGASGVQCAADPSGDTGDAKAPSSRGASGNAGNIGPSGLAGTIVDKDIDTARLQNLMHIMISLPFRLTNFRHTPLREAPANLDKLVTKS